MTLRLDRLSRGPHLPALVASSISREIAEGRLRPGDRLPTEQALASTFGVSRNVVREAIARLRFEGLVWSQQGRGAFVSETKPVVLRLEPSDGHAAGLFASLFDLRDMLEVPAAAQAASLRAEAELDRMRDARDAMLEAPYGSIAWLEGDLDFHRAIAAATRNPYLQQIIGFTGERVRESMLAAGNRSRSDDMAQATLGEHGRILDAVAEGDPDAAAAAMRLHLAGARQRLGLAASGGAASSRSGRSRTARAAS
nr:FadR/GntR family transcriptional regulator [uncultured Lichenicoccus sp.]